MNIINTSSKQPIRMAFRHLRNIVHGTFSKNLRADELTEKEKEVIVASSDLRRKSEGLKTQIDLLVEQIDKRTSGEGHEAQQY